jgi:hypothetical protein
MTKFETGTVVAMLMQQYAIEVTDALVALWFAALGQYPFEDVQKAAVEVLVSYTGTFPPTIGMVATALRKQTEQAEAELSEGEAYKLVLDAIRRFGRYNQASAMYEIRHRSKLVERAVETLGWSEICSWRSEDEAANRAHFWRILAGLRQSTDRRMMTQAAFPSAVVSAEVLKRISNGNK